MAAGVQIYRNNNVKLAASHVSMVAIYILILGGLYLLGLDTGGSGGYLKIAAMIFAPFVLLHTALAVGAYLKIELSRRVSELVFALLLLGFPVGTFLAIYLFLPTCVWVAPDAETA